MIFLSIPYTHQNKQIIEFRVKTLAQYAAKLLQKNEMCLSPILEGTTIFKYASLSSDFAFWKGMSIAMLDLCVEMHVLMVEGWEESIGVQAEIEHAKLKGIPIKYIQCEANIDKS